VVKDADREPIDIQFKGVFLETFKQNFFLSALRIQPKRWYAEVALELYDAHRKRNVAEWYYLIACSQAYYDKPLRKGPKPDPRYFIVQDDFDIKSIRTGAADRISKLKMPTVEAFYDQMQKHFYWEDETLQTIKKPPI
jgi:hypothetical protein